LPSNRRIEPQEDQVWSVVATVLEVKLESDHDFHVVLADLTDPTLTMIAEVPDPGCMPTTDPFLAAIASVRHQFDQYRVESQWVTVNRQATVTGIEFFDKLHGQAGVAPNGIELHPVLKVEWK
jgi:hypothetical protein